MQQQLLPTFKNEKTARVGTTYCASKKLSNQAEGLPAFNWSVEYPKKSLAWFCVCASQAQLAPKKDLEYWQHLQTINSQHTLQHMHQWEIWMSLLLSL